MFKKSLIVALLGTISAFAGKINVIDEQSFEKETNSGTVLVDFYAEWCGPCKRLGPVLELVADDMGNKVKIYKVNIDKSPNLASEYEVQGVPTMVLLKNGKVQGKLVGFRDKSAVKKFIETGK